MDLVKKRKSNIELLKILALFFITIQHCISSSRYPIGASSEEPFVIFGNCIRYLGHLGNAIFVICSSYFLLESKYCNKKKFLFLASDTLIISLLWFIPVAIMEIELPKLVVISEILPISHGNNWFISCYLVFYLIHPFLNNFIHKLTQKELFRIVFIMFIMYCIIQFIVKNAFFLNYILFFIILHFFTAYFKYYMKEYNENIFLNIIILIFSIILYFGLTYVRNYLGITNKDIKNTSLYFNNNILNPFAIFIGFSLFNIFNTKPFYSNALNKFSSLSLLYYLIHENILFRSYIRPMIWDSLLKVNENPFVNLLVLVIIIFSAGLLIAYIYSYTIQRLDYLIIDFLYNPIKNAYIKIESYFFDKTKG